jgi:predicted Zn-dependent peptidase
VTEKLLKVLSDPMSFSEDDLERVKTKVITRIVLSGELPMGRLMALGNEWLCRQRLHSLKGQIDEVQSVSIQDIRNAVEQIGFTQWSRFSLLAEE